VTIHAARGRGSGTRDRLYGVQTMSEPQSDVRHRGDRGVRATGPATRREILDAARRLFAEWGLAGVSVSDLALEADVFPSQVTYYFGSKEALFVEAACRAKPPPLVDVGPGRSVRCILAERALLAHAR